MTISISDTSPRIEYTVGGTPQSAFAVPFEYFDEGDIVAYQGTTLLVLTTDYTLSGGAGAAGTLTTVSPVSNDTITIFTDMPISRTTNFPVSNQFSIDSLNTEMAKHVKMMQQLERDTARSAILSTTISDSVDATLPTPSAGRVIAWDSPATKLTTIDPSTLTLTDTFVNWTKKLFTGDGSETDFTLDSNPNVDANVWVWIDGIYQHSAAWARSGQVVTFDDAPASGALIEVRYGTPSSGAEITAVANVIDDITVVAGIASNVTAVANDATDIGVVAGKSTEIGRLGTTDAVADMNTLGTAAIVTDMDLLATSGNVTAMGLLGTSGNVTAMGLLGVSGVITNMGLLGTAAVVEDMSLLGTTAVVADMALLGTTDVIADMALLATTDAIADMNTLGTADVVSDLNTVAAIAGDVTAVATQVVAYDFSTTTTMGDPGSGNVRFNHATLASVSAIAIDDVDKNGVDQSAFIILWDDSTNTVKGTLVFRTGGGDVATFLITGLTDNSGWSQIAVTHVASSGTFANGEDTFIGFTRAGDKGADGEGSGDVVGPASATDNTAVRFDSTTGKLIQGSGVTIDDSNNVGAASLTLTTDLAVEHGGTGASTLTDGGVLLGSGTGAVTAMAVLADGEMIVGDGTTDPVAESGATLRTSIGVGTGDSPTFAGLTLSADLSVANGGTGGSTASAARSNLGAAALGSNSDITALTGLTTDLSVAQGGTGASTHTANSVLVGAGTSAITSVAPSTSGNVLTSNGTSWTSAAAASSVITLGTANSPTSVSSVTFTGIPAGTNRIELMYAGITFGTSDLLYAQLGDSGGIETSGYLAGATSYTENVNVTTQFRLGNNGMTSQGGTSLIQFSRISGNIWAMHGISWGNLTNSFAGSKTLSGELTQVKLYSGLGNDMTAGTIQISYQT